MGALFTFLFVCSKQISSLVFVISRGAFCCFDEDVHTFTSLFIISTRLLFLHFRIPIYPSSLLLPFISPSTVSTGLFLLHLIYSSSLLLASLHGGMLGLRFELEVLLVAQLVRVLLFIKKDFFRRLICNFLYSVSGLFSSVHFINF